MAEEISSEPQKQQTKRENQGKKSTEDDNVVFIGTKPFMNYVNGVTVQFIQKNQKEVVIKARGKFINRAVDVSEVVKKRFIGNQEVEVKSIKTGSEEFENKEGKKINVSTIEITMMKK